MKTVFLDYIGKGKWAIASDKAMSVIILGPVTDPTRLLQSAANKGWKVYKSEIAEWLCDHDLQTMDWYEQRVRKWSYKHPECVR